MAIRDSLAIIDIPEFKSWLMENGWTIQKVKGNREIVRAIHNDYQHPLIAYKNNDKALFASVPESWYSIIKLFYKTKEADSTIDEKIERCISVVSAIRQKNCTTCVDGCCDSCQWYNIENTISQIFYT